MKIFNLIFLVTLTCQISCNSQNLTLENGNQKNSIPVENDSTIQVNESDFLLLCMDRVIVPKKIIDSLFEQTNNKIDFSLLYNTRKKSQLKNRILYEVLHGNKHYEEILLDGLLSQRNNKYSELEISEWSNLVLDSWAPSDLKTKFLLGFLPLSKPDCSNIPKEIKEDYFALFLQGHSYTKEILKNFNLEDIKDIIEYLAKMEFDILYTYGEKPNLTNCERFKEVYDFVTLELHERYNIGKLRPRDPIEFFCHQSPRFAKAIGEEYVRKNLIQLIKE